MHEKQLMHKAEAQAAAEAAAAEKVELARAFELLSNNQPTRKRPIPGIGGIFEFVSEECDAGPCHSKKPRTPQFTRSRPIKWNQL